MNSAGIHSIRVPLNLSGDSLVPRLAAEFREDREIIRLKGLPLRAYVLRHPELIKQVYTHADVGATKLPQLLPRVRWIMRSGTFIHAGGEQWKRRRKVLQPAFTLANSVRLADQAPAIAKAMLDRWDGFRSKGQSIDLVREFGRFAIDWTFKSLFSVNLDDERLDEITDASRYMLDTFDRVLPVWIPTADNRRFRNIASKIQGVLREIINQRRRDNDENPDDILSLMMEWSDDEIQDEIFSIYFGATIIGMALTWIFITLGQHPPVLEKLVNELNDVLRGQAPTCNDLETLRQPSMIFQETTRLYPPVWVIPRWANKPITVGEVEIPKRSLLLPISYLAHRHPAFWENPNDFWPERFVDGQRIHPFAHFPFGGGPRMCPGRNVAPLVCQLAMILVVQRFELRIVNASSAHFGFETRPHHEVLATINERAMQNVACSGQRGPTE